MNEDLTTGFSKKGGYCSDIGKCEGKKIPDPAEHHHSKFK
jgi:hypothetical protein